MRGGLVGRATLPPFHFNGSMLLRVAWVGRQVGLPGVPPQPPGPFSPGFPGLRGTLPLDQGSPWSGRRGDLGVGWGLPGDPSVSQLVEDGV